MVDNNSSQTIDECGIKLCVYMGHSKPNTGTTFYNFNMKFNRQLILLSLHVYCDMAAEFDRLPQCLDAFSASGIQGLLWKHYLASRVDVYMNDLCHSSFELIKHNCEENGLDAQTPDEIRHTGPLTITGDISEVGIKRVNALNLDANALMYLKSFDFIHLDPFGSCVNYLDAALHNIRSGGLLSLTSTDSAAFYSITPQVSRRSYGFHSYSERPEYHRELAVRMIICQVARSAGRHNKAIEVLVSVAHKHMILVVVKVLRGAKQADNTITNMIGNVIHCTHCQSRVMQKEADHYGSPFLSPCLLLPCKCSDIAHVQQQVDAAMFGPVWIGAIYNCDFVKKMLHIAEHKLPREHYKDDAQLTKLLRLLIEDAYSSNCLSPIMPATQRNELPPEKKQKRSSQIIPFYYLIPHHSSRGVNLPKKQKLMEKLKKFGFIAAETHFDKLAVRTNCSVSDFKTHMEN